METQEKYTTFIDGKEYEFQMTRMSLSSRWLAQAYQNGHRKFTLFSSNGPENAALELVKLIETLKQK